MIELNGIKKEYRRGEITVPVLRSLDLKIEASEFVAIMGPSGSGKSTLLNIIGCLDVPDTGQYKFRGNLLNAANEDELSGLRNREFGFVFQSFHLLSRHSALHNVELPMVYARISPVERRRRATESLINVGLGDRLEHTSAQLSGGQQQRVAIARALVNNPSVLIADEPTGSLDTESGDEILAIFDRLHQQKVAIIMVTHDLDVANHADRIIYVRDGKIEKERRK